MNRHQRTIFKFTKRYAVARLISYQDSRLIAKGLLRYCGFYEFINFVMVAECNKTYQELRMKRLNLLIDRKEILKTSIISIEWYIKALGDHAIESESIPSVRYLELYYQKLLSQTRIELIKVNKDINVLKQFESSVTIILN